MSGVNSIHVKDVEDVVRKVLGSRVRFVESAERTNDDGAAVLKVRVVYDAAAAPTVEEMEGVFDALWSIGHLVNAPFPVIDFQEDTDVTPLAAE